MSLAKVAELAHTSPQQINRLEKGERRMTREWGERLAMVYSVTPAELLDENIGLSVPIRYNIYSAFADGIADAPAIPQFGKSAGELQRINAPPRLAKPEQCFAANVLDNSADKLYPPGSALIAREVAHVKALRPGQKVIVVRYADENHSRVMEVLVGVLDRSATGDLMLTLRSNQRELPGSVLVQAAARPEGLRERPLIFTTTPDEALIYAPRADDLSFIVGAVVVAITPED